jgi:hypothetical protein
MADQEPRNQALAVALVGGALGAAAGVAGVISARAIARRNRDSCGEINAVLKTAATACELSHRQAGEVAG